MKITLDKIASVTKNVDLRREVNITDDIAPENGLLLAVEVLEDKKIYNKLELVSGRLSTLKRGDIIAVVLGNRKALRGFVGKTPTTLKSGDIIHILNIGGVAGMCVSANIKEVGDPLKVKVLGAITDGEKALNIKNFTKFKLQDQLKSQIPLIVVSATCMHVGKTTVACEIIKHAFHNNFTVVAAKLSGVAALKDTENMKDYGAAKAVSFLDAGCPSTVNSKWESAKIAKGAIDYLSEGNPDYIVIEFGDGVFGEYGVMDILKDPEIQQNIVAHIGCAYDPMGVVKLAEVCEEIGAPLTAISGPVTDNEVGVGFVGETLGLPSFNAYKNPQELFDYLLKSCLKR